MVKIGQKDFNQSMDKYIKKRRKDNDESNNLGLKDLFSGIKMKKIEISEWKVFSMFKPRTKYVDEEELEDEIEEDEYFEEEETQLKEINEVEDDLEEERENVLKRFFKKLRFFKRKKIDEEDEDYYEETEEECDDLDEVKEVIKITHKWLEELPPEKINQFKRSEDFQKYKQILKKLEMIK